MLSVSKDNIYIYISEQRKIKSWCENISDWLTYLICKYLLFVREDLNANEITDFRPRDKLLNSSSIHVDVS